MKEEKFNSGKVTESWMIRKLNINILKQLQIKTNSVPKGIRLTALKYKLQVNDIDFINVMATFKRNENGKKKKEKKLHQTVNKECNKGKIYWQWHTRDMIVLFPTSIPRNDEINVQTGKKEEEKKKETCKV